MSLINNEDLVPFGQIFVVFPKISSSYVHLGCNLHVEGCSSHLMTTFKTISFLYDFTSWCKYVVTSDDPKHCSKIDVFKCIEDKRNILYISGF